MYEGGEDEEEVKENYRGDGMDEDFEKENREDEQSSDEEFDLDNEE